MTIEQANQQIAASGTAMRYWRKFSPPSTAANTAAASTSYAT